MKKKVGVVGASGYGGEELVRILSTHPDVELSCLVARSLTGKVADAMPQYREKISKDLEFSPANIEEQAKNKDIDIWFLALPHGVSSQWAIPFINENKTVIDLSADFRLYDAITYENYYKVKHPNPELLETSPYVLADFEKGSSWKNSSLIACPGCYPTSILLPSLPLLKAGLISQKNLVVNSFSGVSGAGKKVALDYLYCQRNESSKAYGLGGHRHLSEIEEQMQKITGDKTPITFNPHLAPMKRGIITTITVPANEGATVEKVYNVWNENYSNKPFVAILPSGTYPDSANVSYTNRCDMSCVYDERCGNFIITSSIDNLIKGASGQAVQLMNLKFGFEETAGLL